MRYPIWEKDDFFQVGEVRYDMDPAIVTWDEDKLPLTWLFNHQDLPRGHVKDIRLEDGEITGEIVFTDPQITDELIREANLRFGGYYTPVEKENGVVTKARLRAVSIVMAKPGGANPEFVPGANPGAHIDK
jgi:hypothetical protein